MNDPEFKAGLQREIDKCNHAMHIKIIHTLVRKLGGEVTLHVKDLARMQHEEQLEITPLDYDTFTRTIRAK